MNRNFLILIMLFAGIIRAAAQQDAITITQSYLVSKGLTEQPVERKHAESAENILSGILSQASGASGSRYSVFGLTPALSLLEEGKIEGVKTLITAKVNVNVKVQNLISSETLGSFDLTLTGSGKTRAEAINKAIQQMRSKKDQISKEIAGFDQKIKSYYDKNCDKIAATAREYVAKKEYQAALAILHGIPAESSCFTAVEAQKNQVFASVQAQECSNFIKRADAFTAANNFVAALQVLSQVDASAPCAAEVTTKIADIETKLDAAQKEQWEWLFKFWSAGAEAEKAKWNAITAIAMNWLRSNGKYELLEK